MAASPVSIQEQRGNQSSFQSSLMENRTQYKQSMLVHFYHIYILMGTWNSSSNIWTVKAFISEHHYEFIFSVFRLTFYFSQKYMLYYIIWDDDNAETWWHHQQTRTSMLPHWVFVIYMLWQVSWSSASRDYLNVNRKIFLLT